MQRSSVPVGTVLRFFLRSPSVISAPAMQREQPQRPELTVPEVGLATACT
jgi:hypothetical protein